MATAVTKPAPALALVRIVAVPLAFVAAGCRVPAATNGPADAIATYRASRGTDGSLRVPPAVRSAPLLATAGTFTPDQAVALALKNSARVAELSARVDAAAAAVGLAGQRQNPEIRVTRMRLDRTLDDRARISPYVRIHPERPGEIAAREAEARAHETYARAELRAEELAIEADVRSLCDDVLLLAAESAAADRVAASRHTLATRTRERVTSASATAVEANLTELSAIDAEGTRKARHAEHDLALSTLLDRIGAPPTAEMRLVGELETSWPPPRLPPEEVLVETALRHDARIAGAAARIDGTAARLDLERRRQWPWLSFVDLGYAFTPSTDPGLGWTVGAGVEFPLFHSNGGGVRTAEQSAVASRRALAAETERITRDVRARMRAVAAAETLVSAMREEAAPILERTRAETARALELGSIDAVRAAMVEDRRASVEVHLLATMRRYRTALSDLRRVVGGGPFTRR